jgi:hypothetical protein
VRRKIDGFYNFSLFPVGIFSLVLHAFRYFQSFPILHSFQLPVELASLFELKQSFFTVRDHSIQSNLSSISIVEKNLNKFFQNATLKKDSPSSPPLLPPSPRRSIRHRNHNSLLGLLQAILCMVWQGHLGIRLNSRGDMRY